MWEQAEATWTRPGIVEYGIYQIDVRAGTPIWRRHDKRRFDSVRNALFGQQGAGNACKGIAPYPKERYAVGTDLFVPYAATWISGFSSAYLVRASSDAPEVTLVSVDRIECFAPQSDQQALAELAALFAAGAATHGVRYLHRNGIEVP